MAKFCHLVLRDFQGRTKGKLATIFNTNIASSLAKLGPKLVTIACSLFKILGTTEIGCQQN